MTQVAVVLAAGKSTRMRSRIPKAAHSIAGRPLLAHVLFAANAALDDARFATPNSLLTSAHEAEDRGSQLVVVLGHEAERVKQALLEVRGLPSYQVALQAAPLGTGDAVRAALPLLTGNGPERPTTVLVLYGDSPLVRPATLTRLLVTHEQAGATVTFLTGEADRDTGYGRIVRDTAGLVRGIIEERHCTPEQLGITEVNSGIYCFQADWLWSRLSRVESHPSGEYYLTDLVDLAANEGRHIETISAPLNETAGVNDRVELSEAAAILRRRTLDDLMRSGVTIVDPATTDVDCGIPVGMDTTIYPFTVLHGATEIGENCTIGPYSSIQDSLIGDNCTVLGSWLESAVMDAGARVGPMSHLRPGTHLGTGVFLGNFGEIKN
ncbi:MAG TPA: NTP transferase domain-containing protein, partial [Ktedonobacterales bacterium]|nr:NTP transferase domain-containing protein [Ktedonobacterales bacterium]